MPLPDRTRRLAVRWLIVLLVVAVGLEAGSRLLDRVRGIPFDPEASRAEIERICAMLSRFAHEQGSADADPAERHLSTASILSPYTGWEEARTAQRFADDLATYRSEDADRAVDLLILGGSVAQDFAELGSERLARRLEADPTLAGREVRVHDFSLPGYKQPQQEIVLAYLLALGCKPDLVLEIDGFNEAALGWRNAKTGIHPTYPSVSHWMKATTGLDTRWEMLERLYELRASQDRARAFGEWLLRSNLWRSCFLGHVGSLVLEKFRGTYVESYEQLMAGVGERWEGGVLQGPPVPPDDEGIVRAIVDVWEECSVSMSGVCAAHGIAYLHVLQPTLHDTGSKPWSPQEHKWNVADPRWVEGVHQVYPHLREAGARLAARGIAFFDGSYVFREREETIYVDVCHFAERGNEILADALVEPALDLLRR